MLVSILMLVLAGCQNSARTGENVPEKTATEENGQEAETSANDGEKAILEESGNQQKKEVDEENTIYNVSAKKAYGCTYVATQKGLYEIADDDSAWKLLYEGPVSLGAIGDKFLFFYTYPEQTADAALMAIRLSDKKIVTSLPVGDDIWDYREMFLNGSDLSILCANEIRKFQVLEDGTLSEKLVLSRNEITDEIRNKYGIQNEIGLDLTILSQSEGLSQSYYKVQEDGKEMCNVLYIIEGNNIQNKIENITDAMITKKGIVGRDYNNYQDLYLWDINGNNKKLLYSAGNQSETYIGYNTYDENGIYGMSQEGSDTYVIQLTWNGQLNKLFPVHNLKFGTELNMSIIDEWLYYYNTGEKRMERRKIIDASIIETEF